jgi:hypothetical protein
MSPQQAYRDSPKFKRAARAAARQQAAQARAARPRTLANVGGQYAPLRRV